MLDAMLTLVRRLGARSAMVGFLGALVMLVGCTHDYSDADIEFVQLGELKALTTGKQASTVMLIDPRAPVDYDAGHLPGARNYQINSERSRTGDALNPVFSGYKHLIVYGEDPSSGTAKAMTKRLMNKGAKGVRMYAGGLIEWRRAGLAVEKTETPAKPGEAPAPAPAPK